MKLFQSEQINRLKEIEGKRFENILFQPTAGILDDDIFVLNFGKDTEYSLHVGCFLRIISKDRILLTSSDEFFGEDFKEISYKDSEKNTGKSLLAVNLVAVKKILKSAIVKEVNVSSTADIMIKFDNEVKVEIITDCLCQDYEYYRFISYKNEYEHLIVCCKDGNICIFNEK